MERPIRLALLLCPLLMLLHSASSQLGPEELAKCDTGVKTNRYGEIFCPALDIFPEWCNCRGEADISLTRRGIVDDIKRSPIRYYFDNLEGESARCKGDNRFCLCPKGENCGGCESSNGSRIMCLMVLNKHVLATEHPPDGPFCNISSLCHDKCNQVCGRNNPFPDPIGPRVNVTTPTDKQATDPPVADSSGLEQAAIGAGAAVAFFLVLALLVVVVVCFRRKKDTNKKKEGPYEAVYSTIDDGSLRNGSVMTPPRIFPNQLYDARVEGGPPIPPSRPGVPSHYKSLPSLLVGDYFSSGSHQPHLPHHQPVWTNGPTLHRYPSTDVITSGYLPYGHNPEAPPGAPYMYLKKKPKQQYQSLSPTVEMRPDQLAEFRMLAAKGRPGYKSPTSEDNTWTTTSRDDYQPLTRDLRSLPADGSPREVEVPRQHATYGYERKAQKPRSSSGRSSSKPIPAKRGVYRSGGKTMAERGASSSDSEDEAYQGSGSEGGPYYFKMSTNASVNQSETIAYDSKDQGTSAPPVQEGKKKNSARRKPKPRSRRPRRRPTTEVTCAMIENPLASNSNDDSDMARSAEEYTDEDIDEGLTQMEDSSTTEQPEAGDEFDNSDYMHLNTTS